MSGKIERILHWRCKDGTTWRSREEAETHQRECDTREITEALTDLLYDCYTKTETAGADTLYQHMHRVALKLVEKKETLHGIVVDLLIKSGGVIPQKIKQREDENEPCHICKGAVGGCRDCSGWGLENKRGWR